jgi:hypothetical protein
MIKRHTAQSNVLLGILRTRPRAPGESFRTNPRHESSAPARLSWDEGSKQRVVAARLVNICRAGAALITSVPPPVGSPLLVRLMGETPTPWIEAIILAADPRGEQRFRVRLKFRELCPNIFLKSAVLPVATEQSPRPGRIEEDRA